MFLFLLIHVGWVERSETHQYGYWAMVYLIAQEKIISG